MAEYTIDKIAYNGDVYKLQDNQSGYITTETDPVFSASPAAGISATDISNWNSKVSDTEKWGGVTLGSGRADATVDLWIPTKEDNSNTSGVAYWIKTTQELPTSSAVEYVQIPRYKRINNQWYLQSTTPSANDNSTKVATTAYVDGALSGVAGTDEKVKQNSINSSFNAEKNILLGNRLDSSLSDNSDINTTYKATWLTYQSGGGKGPYLYIKNPSDASSNFIRIGYSGITWKRDGYASFLQSNTLTSDRVLRLPDASGTIALTSDVPSISLNGSSTTSASFYAPTTAGTSGQVLTSNGSGAPTWAAAPSGSSTQIIRWTES